MCARAIHACRRNINITNRGSTTGIQHGNRDEEKLEVPGMSKVACCITARDDLKHLVHIVENTIVRRRSVVVLIPSNEMLDFRKGLLDWVQVGGIRWQVFNANVEAVSEGEDVVSMVYFCIVEH